MHSEHPVYLSVHYTGLTAKPGKHSFDWAEFTVGFQPEVIPHRELFDLVAAGHSIAPVMGGDGSRCQENFDRAQHIGLDFDNETPDERLVASPVTLDTLLAVPFVRAYGSLIVPTLSHRPEWPRYRLFFVLDEPIFDADEYRQVLQALRALFPMADPACLEISRAYFGNGRIQQEGMWDACANLGNLLPLADLRLYVQQWRRRQQRSAQTPQRLYQSRPQRQGYSRELALDDVMAQLHAIDPYAMPYQDWLKLGCAIAHTFGDGAFFQFKNWSDRPGKPELTWRKWQTWAAPHPNPAGAGSIIDIIRKYGRAA